MPFSLTHVRPLVLAGLFALGVIVSVPGAQANVRLSPAFGAPSASRDLGARRAAAHASASGPQYLSLSQVRSAYALPKTGARGQRIALISAFDDPSAEADLKAYTSYYGIPGCAAKSGCFKKLNQFGKPSPLPGPDLSGGQFTTESATGIELARGICQSCSILLVEANTTGRKDLSAAAAAAAQAGATVIVTTYIFSEDQVFDPQFAPAYLSTKAPVIAAVGDDGYTGNVNFPSALPNVLAVGGTQLRPGHGEQAYSDTVSGCSSYEPAPSWQAKEATAFGCQGKRPVADLSAMAEPGLLVHITGSGQPGGPWFVADGTSVSAPIIAGAIGLAGSVGSREAQMVYQRWHSHPGDFHDIRIGGNAPGCTPSLVCRAAPGFDGPTGAGTPFGLAAFLASGGAIAAKHPAIKPAIPRKGLRASARWQVRLGIDNGNAFAVTGSLTMLGRSHGHTVKFASAEVKLSPLANRTQSFTISKSGRGVLRTLGSVSVSLRLRLHGPAGKAVTLTRKVTLHAP